MKLALTELRVLEYMAAHRSVSVAEAASALGLKVPQLSRALASLSTKGLIYSQRHGKSKHIALADTKHATLFRTMSFQLSHMKLALLLSGASLEVLSALCNLRLRSRHEIADRSGISEAWVARVVASLKRVGIVTKTNSHYAVLPRFQILADFVTEFRRYLNQKAARSFAEDAVIVWERNNEFIVETPKGQGQRGFYLTGPSAFGRFGIPLIMPSYYYYYYSPESRGIALEDAIIHSLLVPHSERTIMAALLAMKKNEKSLRVQRLVDKAREYGQEDEIGAMIAHLDSKGAKGAKGLPAWSEFESKMCA